MTTFIRQSEASRKKNKGVQQSQVFLKFLLKSSIWSNIEGRVAQIIYISCRQCFSTTMKMQTAGGFILPSVNVLLFLDQILISNAPFLSTKAFLLWPCDLFSGYPVTSNLLRFFSSCFILHIEDKKRRILVNSQMLLQLLKGRYGKLEWF